MQAHKAPATALALELSGTTLTFVGTLGLLALAGIIVNNAILLIDAIDEARASGVPDAQAIEDAASKRLRPIVMTKLVCILGLLPLWLFGGAVWESLSVVMMGGLALGTLITLGLIPALYAQQRDAPSRHRPRRLLRMRPCAWPSASMPMSLLARLTGCDAPAR